MENDLEMQFDTALRRNIKEAKTLGYNPTYFSQMLADMGGLAMAQKLLATNNPSEGFQTLKDLGRTDLSLEALVLKYAALFSDEELQEAHQRVFAVEQG